MYDLGSFTNVSNRTQRMKGFDLEPYRGFLKKIGNPQDGLKYIHVAGSKGKGTTCTYMAQILWSLGYKTGLYTSPYLESIREEFWLNGEQIEEDEFVEILLLVKEKMENEKVRLSYYEFITTMIFYYFQRHEVDFVVLEVGLGGLKDATNVVTPILTILTQLEFEHTDVLGNTIEEIASNKLGIVKIGVPLVVMPQKYDVKKQIVTKMKEFNTKAIFVNQIFEYKVEAMDETGTVLSILSSEIAQFSSQKIKLKMLGEQFAHSFLTAICALNILIENNSALLEKSILLAEKMQLPWRCELKKTQNGQTVILDMAHTVEGLRYLRSTLDTVFKDASFLFLVASLQDKDVKTMFANLLHEKDEIIVTSCSNPRAMDAQKLAVEAGFINVGSNLLLIENDPKLALDIALKKTKTDKVLVLTGSHYLLSDLSFFFRR